MTLEDILSDLTANLVQLGKNSLFAQRLFSVDEGTWVELAALCKNLNGVDTRLEQLETSLRAKPQVSWLDYPHSMNGPGYVMIIFFVEKTHWSNVALYNKQQLSGQAPAS